jgi:hypothetical membrane protein
VHRAVARALNAAGIAAPILWLAALVYFGSLDPEYNHSRQYVSELAARGAPSQRGMQAAGFILPGLMVVGFGLLVGLSAHSKRAGVGAALLMVGGLGRVIAGVFPLDPCCATTAPSFSERVHNAAGAGYVLAMAAAVLIWCAVAEPAFRTRASWFRWYSLVTFVTALTLPWLLIRFGTDPANVGLFQRASFGVLNLWVFVFAVVVWVRLSNRALQSRSAQPPPLF